MPARIFANNISLENQHSIDSSQTKETYWAKGDPTPNSNVSTIKIQKNVTMALLL
jgi:hypothetical protein